MHTAENLTEVVNEAKSSVNDVCLQTFKDYCRKIPKGLGIAAGVGALASLILMKASAGRNRPRSNPLSFLRKGEEVWII